MNINQRTSFPKWRAFCAQAHAKVGQTYGDHPYSYHLARVEEALMRFGFSAQAYRMAAWGHDLIEDTKETRRSLLNQGISMLTLMGIWGVTDEPGATRKARKLRTYPKFVDIALPLSSSLLIASQMSKRTSGPEIARASRSIAVNIRSWKAISATATTREQSACGVISTGCSKTVLS